MDRRTLFGMLAGAPVVLEAASLKPAETLTIKLELSRETLLELAGIEEEIKQAQKDAEELRQLKATIGDRRQAAENLLKDLGIEDPEHALSRVGYSVRPLAEAIP